MLNLIKTAKALLNCESKLVPSQVNALFHTSNVLDKSYNTSNRGKPLKWKEYNKYIYEPQLSHEEPRPAYICHQKENIRYSPKKMWYIAAFVRGMSVDEAIKQLSFIQKKGGAAIKETILEAQEMAVKNHNVEFKSNLWITESFTGKGTYFKGVRRHGRGRIGQVNYKHCHYFVRLEEGKPPENFYLPYPRTPEQQLDDWLDQMRKRKVYNGM